MEDEKNFNDEKNFTRVYDKMLRTSWWALTDEEQNTYIEEVAAFNREYEEYCKKFDF